MNALPDYNLDPPESKWPSFDELHQDYIDKRAGDYIRHWTRNDEAVHDTFISSVDDIPCHTLAQLLRSDDLCEIGRALKAAFNARFAEDAADYVRDEYEGNLPHGARFNVPEFVP